MHSVAQIMPSNSIPRDVVVKEPQPSKSSHAKPLRSLHELAGLETMQDITPENLKAVVALPEAEDIRVWLATNVADFAAEVSLLYSLCKEDAARFREAGEGFPLGVGNAHEWGADWIQKTYTAPQYIEFVLVWIDQEIGNLPEPGPDNLPEEFEILASQIVRRLLGVFDLMYYCHFKVIKELDASRLLNTTFMRFIFFVLEFELIEDLELISVHPVTRIFKSEYFKHQGFAPKKPS